MGTQGNPAQSDGQHQPTELRFSRKTKKRSFGNDGFSQGFAWISSEYDEVCFIYSLFLYYFIYNYIDYLYLKFKTVLASAMGYRVADGFQSVKHYFYAVCK